MAVRVRASPAPRIVTSQRAPPLIVFDYYAHAVRCGCDTVRRWPFESLSLMFDARVWPATADATRRPPYAEVRAHRPTATGMAADRATSWATGRVLSRVVVRGITPPAAASRRFPHAGAVLKSRHLHQVIFEIARCADVIYMQIPYMWTIYKSYGGRYCVTSRISYFCVHNSTASPPPLPRRNPPTTAIATKPLPRC